MQCQRTGEGLKPRSHKELMKELELPSIEDRGMGSLLSKL